MVEILILTPRMKLHEMSSLILYANQRREPLLREVFAPIKLAARRQEALLTPEFCLLQVEPRLNQPQRTHAHAERVATPIRSIIQASASLQVLE